MILRSLTAAAFALLATQGSLAAQDSAAAGPPTLIVDLPAPTMLNAFPQAWRDSVVSAWRRRATVERLRAVGRLRPGTYGEVTLQLLRNGDLRRARIRHSTANQALDSLLLTIAHDADEALAYPAFPPGVEGAGTEVTLEVRVPLAQPLATRPSAGAQPATVQVLSAARACDTAFAPPTGGAETMLWAWVDSAQGGPDVVEWARRALTSMQSEFAVDGMLMPVRRPAVLRDPHVLETNFASTRGWVRLRVEPTGRLRTADVVVASGYPALDSALLRMFHRADSAGLIPPPPASTDSTSIDVAVEPGRVAPRLAVPLGKVTLAEWLAQPPPSVLRPGMPRYPSNLRQARVGGRVNMEFIVDRDGDVIGSSMRILASPHPDLTQAAAEAVLRTKYRPGEIHGCPIPVMVRQAVNFRP